MKRAIVTLAVGAKHLNNFNSYCRRSWTRYAERHNLDLVVLTDALDNSERALSRSPAWQKCLILSLEPINRYDRVAWLDSDIIINPESPDIFLGVPMDKIGAIDCYANPNPGDYAKWLERLYDHWTKRGSSFVRNATPTEYHSRFGLTGNFTSVVQTGVLVLSPTYHRDLLQRVYYGYEDKEATEWNYEMRPLSYEILKADLAFWIDGKFNAEWALIRQNLYPFAYDLNFYEKLTNRVLRSLGFNVSMGLMGKCATTAFLNNYFLHFSGCSSEMRFVNQEVTSIFDV